MRVARRLETGHLKPSTLIPSDSKHQSPVPAFKHGAQGDIHLFKTKRGWFFKKIKEPILRFISLNIYELI